MALEVKNLFARVEGKEVLRGVSLKIKAGEITALMGPNGSGKSSLAQTLMGNPRYEVVVAKEFYLGRAPATAELPSEEKFLETVVSLDGVSLIGKRPDERAKMGLFLASQHLLGVAGVNVKEILLIALRARGQQISAFDLKKRVEQEARRMGIDKSLLARGINDGFSGGEKKKMEILQMKILRPKYVILDEIDSGLDIDALKIVANEVRKAAEEGAGFLLITHHKKILEYLRPERVSVVKKGEIVLQGGRELIEKLEEKGYKDL